MTPYVVLWMVYKWGVALAFLPLLYFVHSRVERDRDKVLEWLDRENEAFMERLAKKWEISLHGKWRVRHAARRRRIGLAFVVVETPLLAFLFALGWPLLLFRMFPKIQ